MYDIYLFPLAGAKLGNVCSGCWGSQPRRRWWGRWLGGRGTTKCKEEAQPLALPVSVPGVARGVWAGELGVCVLAMRFCQTSILPSVYTNSLRMCMGVGKGRGETEGAGKDERDRGTRILWPALLGCRKEKGRGESTWNFSKKSGRDHEGSSFLPFFLD